MVSSKMRVENYCNQDRAAETLEIKRPIEKESIINAQTYQERSISWENNRILPEET